MAHEGSNIPYREIGIPDGHHALSHNGNKPDMMEKLRKINTFHISLFTHFLEQLDSIRDGDGNTLLDNSMVVYGGGLSDGNLHTQANLPVLFGGAQRGQLRGGVHLRYSAETPITNLFLSMLDMMGVPVDSLGDSTGRLNRLSLV